MLKTLQLLLVLLISACSRSPKTPTENSAQVVETQEGPGPSKMLTFQPIAGGGNLHFSVYYPAGFSENRLFPVLIFLTLMALRMFRSINTGNLPINTDSYSWGHMKVRMVTAQGKRQILSTEWPLRHGVYPKQILP